MVIRKLRDRRRRGAAAVETALVMILVDIVHVWRFRVFPAPHGLELAQQRCPGRLPLRHRQQHRPHDQHRRSNDRHQLHGGANAQVSATSP